MPTTNRQARGAAVVVLSVITGTLLAFSGFLAGSYLRERLGPQQTDPDEMESYERGLLVGGVSALGLPKNTLGIHFSFQSLARCPSRNSFLLITIHFHGGGGLLLPRTPRLADRGRLAD